jgi:hypothetical protein
VVVVVPRQQMKAVPREILGVIGFFVYEFEVYSTDSPKNDQ